MKRLHLCPGIVKISSTINEGTWKFHNRKLLERANYVFCDILDSTTSRKYHVMKNRYGIRGDVTKAEHTRALNDAFSVAHQVHGIYRPELNIRQKGLVDDLVL